MTDNEKRLAVLSEAADLVLKGILIVLSMMRLILHLASEPTIG